MKWKRLRATRTMAMPTHTNIKMSGSLCHAHLPKENGGIPLRSTCGKNPN